MSQDQPTRRVGASRLVYDKASQMIVSTKPVPDLGRIGALAEDLRCAARAVTNDMVLSPSGDAYEYRGSTSSVEWLIEALNNLEHFQAGWR